MSQPLWDVFISHASEDTERVAKPLADLLSTAGLRVWLDENEVRLGDSLRRKIDHGLAESRYGVVILSPSFFAKEWTQRELDALTALSSASDKIILPVWHGVNQQSVARHSPLLADKVAVSTERGLDQVALAIISVVGGSAPENPPIPPEFQNPASFIGSSLNDYRLTEFLGSGGSGLVFRAIRHTTGEEFAIKIFYPLRDSLSHIADLLERSFRPLSALRHPNIAGVFEFSHTGHLTYLVMELIRGVPLDEWSNAIGKRRDALACRLDAALQLTQALSAAHNAKHSDELGFEVRGILHGDIKPANVLVNDQGQLKLLDFLLIDIQRLLDPTVIPSEHLHKPNRKRDLTEAFGTPGFMAPEQEQHGIVTVRTDIFSLGVTFAYLFAPETDDPVAVILQRTMPEQLIKLIAEMISEIPAVRPSLESIIKRLYLILEALPAAGAPIAGP